MNPPRLSARTFYGLRTDIQYNAHYISDVDVVYPAGGVLVLHNHLQKRQIFMRLADKLKPIKSIVLSPNRRWLAVNEIGDEGQKPSITIYDLRSYKRRKILTVPFEKSTAREFACIQFTHDSKHLVAITGEPDWWLYYYNWDKGKVESHAKAQNSSGVGTITHVQCNPTDATLIVVTGPATFRIMNVAETVWRQWGWCKAENLIVTTCVWLTPDRILFGTHQGWLMLVENGELRHNCVYRASDVNEMLMRKVIEETTQEDQPEPSEVKTADDKSQAADQPVTCLVNFAKGFVYACGEGYVHMFEKENLQLWKKRNIYRICRDSYSHAKDSPMWTELDAIQHIAVDPTQEHMLVTTNKPQLYHVKLFGPHISQVPEIHFAELGPSLHYGRICSISMCAWKPIFMTAGADDCSIRVWNYETGDVELIKNYQEEIHCVSLHPTGLFAVVGLSAALRYVSVRLDALAPVREVAVRACRRAAFSHSGHAFAAVPAVSTNVQVFCAISFTNIYNFKGHNGLVTSLSWSANDLTLVSCGSEGAVYEWDLATGQRKGEVILKTNQFHACAVNSAGKQTYAVGSDGEMKEITSSSIRRNLPVIGCSLDCLVLSRSDMMLFVSGGSGGVTSVQLPLLDKVVSREYHMHISRVCGLALAYDDQTLVSVSADASVCIWRLTNADGRAIALEKDFTHAQEILISKDDLQEKINSICLLGTRLQELESEHVYQLRQSEVVHADTLQEVHQGYAAAIQLLREKNEVMENEHNHEIGLIQQDITKIKSNHESHLQNLEADFNVKLIGEYDKYQHLEDKTARMREDYERRLEELATSKRSALRDVTEHYEAQLQEKEVVLAELQVQGEVEIKEHENIKSAIEDDADREILEVRAAYELQLRGEKDANVRLKGETGVVKKKLITAHKEMEEFKHQVSQLKAEHIQFQKIIQTLEKDIMDLKKEISERDSTIQDKEKRLYELKRKNEELKKYKFVLNFKITELKNEIEPKEREIEELRLQIEDMEGEEAKLIATKKELEMKLSQLSEKLSAAKKDYTDELERTVVLKSTLKKIKIDLYNITGDMKDPLQLKSSVRALYHAYVDDGEMVRGRLAEEAAAREFGRQREHLERRLATLAQQLRKAAGGGDSDATKLVEENCELLSEINLLRSELKKMRSRCAEMESVLGVSARYMTPARARDKLRRATEQRHQLDDVRRAEVEEKEAIVVALKHENDRLLNKLKCVEDDRNIPEEDEENVAI